MPTTDRPLFPLREVLFPGGPLRLRIFEPRYLDMIGRCLRRDHGFGVVLIDSGSEVGPATFASVGTMARILDWHRGRDGLLGILAEGGERFRVRRWRQQDDGLYVGELERLEPEPVVSLPRAYRHLGALVEDLLDDLGAPYDRIRRSSDDAAWVAFRLAELLPLPAETRQSLLELTDAGERLALLRHHLQPRQSTLS